MFEKISRILFSLCFLLMLAVPLAMTNFEEGRISESEKRKMAPMAWLKNEDGSFNKDFTADFETWINDNIGLRAELVVANAKIQYHVFRVLSNNSDMYLGPNGELNYATRAMLKDYQHANRYSGQRLKEIASAMQYLSDYVEEHGARFYYYQCWDKHSIYPEHFPESVLQTPGTESKTDGVIRVLTKDTDVRVISPKQDLIDGKMQYGTYSVWGDPTHWTPRGAYLGYRKLMNSINEDAETPYRILQESDYTITMEDQGEVLFGGIHEADVFEAFEIRDPKAVLTEEKLTFLSEEKRHRFFTNEHADNRDRVLVIGDSYFNSFLIDDLAESFYETIMLWGDYLNDIDRIMEEYEPDIVILEAAERLDRTTRVMNTVKALKEKQ